MSTSIYTQFKAFLALAILAALRRGGILRTLAAGPALLFLLLASVTAFGASGPFPKIIRTPNGSAPEGFTIGKGTTAYNASPDGSIYKVDLRTGLGDILVPVQDPEGCLVLGMRVDPRTNYLFVAGCIAGNAFVYDADNGALIMEYQLGPAGLGVVNDLAITEDAVYFTDSYRPVLYRLPLSKNGGLPPNSDGVTEIPLPPEFELDIDNDPCCGGNGIVAAPDGKTLIIGHSNLAQLYRVDPSTGDVDAISVDRPLFGFLDGIAMKGRTLFIMTPTDPPPIEGIQVVKLDKSMLSGRRLRTITDPDHLNDVASGAIFGNSLYVNNPRYQIFPPKPNTKYWITKLKLHDYDSDSDD